MSSVSANTVLVTGGREFIGASVVEALKRAGFEARAGVRRPVAPQFACDLDDAAETRAATAGAGLVVHAAYGDYSAMARQCANLLAAMSAAGVASLVYFSSIAVYGARDGVVDESAGPVGGLDAYARGKVDCEALVRAWADDAAHPDRRAVVLRPGIVYGRGSRFWIDRLAERIRAGVWGDFGAAGEGIAALIHVDDVAELVARAAQRLCGPDRAGLPRVATLNAVGAETPSWNAYFAALAAALGAPLLPALDAGALARTTKLGLAAKAWKKIGLPGFTAMSLAPTAGELALFSRKADYDTRTSRELLGFAPRISLAEGLRRSGLQPKT